MQTFLIILLITLSFCTPCTHNIGNNDCNTTPYVIHDTEGRICWNYPMHMCKILFKPNGVTPRKYLFSMDAQLPSIAYNVSLFDDDWQISRVFLQGPKEPYLTREYIYTAFYPIKESVLAEFGAPSKINRFQIWIDFNVKESTH